MLLLGADKDRICEYVRHVSKKSLDKKNLFNMYETAIKQQREISRERAVMLVQKAYCELGKFFLNVLVLFLALQLLPLKRKLIKYCPSCLRLPARRDEVVNRNPSLKTFSTLSMTG